MFLGIVGPGPNPSACIINNGELLFWSEEERYTRIKTSPNSFPHNSIKDGLDYLSLGLDSIKAIGYAWDCPNYANEAKKNMESIIKTLPSESDELNRAAQERLNLTY